MKSSLNRESSSIFLLNCKPYIKIELEIFSEVEDVNALGLLLYINVAIHNISNPTISDSARNILRRFPSWTDIYEDSIEQATPELATPITTGGKFINALVSQYLDDFNTQLDIANLNNYLSTSDVNTPAWGYVSYNIPAAGLDFRGDSIKLAKASSIEEFSLAKSTDFIYYHNLIDSQVTTLRRFDNFTIDGTIYHQEPTLLFNIFDEFGARVGVKRLYLEENANFKKRILDAFLNPPSVSADGFKKSLRRELDIWRAYGSTPDSNYLGATPEILEITDIESSTPYFSDAGNPEKRFYDFVKYINQKYPSNLGYVDWENGIWDYAGLNNEGVGYIPSVYDNATPLGLYFQPGVGDFDDLKIEISKNDTSTVSFEGYFKASGFKTESYDDHYMPINMDYSYRMQYEQSIPDPYVNNPNSATPFNGGVAVVYEIDLPADTQYSTPSSFYANLNYKDRQDFFVYNYYGQDHPSSPEYNYIKVVNSDNLTNPNIIFKEKTYDYLYENNISTPSSSLIDVSKATNVRIVNKVEWNQQLQRYIPVHTGQYRVAFDKATPTYVNNPVVQSSVLMATPSINYVNANFKIGSTVYGTTPSINYSNTINDKIVINKDSDPAITSDELIYVSDLTKNLSIPVDATPKRLIVENTKINSQPIFTIDEIFRDPGQPITAQVYLPKYGGESYYSILDTKYFVPSSPNIILNTYTQEEFTTPVYSNYFESATFNYSSLPYILAVTNNIQSTPNYPFKSPIWEPTYDGELRTTPMITGYLDYLGNVYRTTEDATPLRNETNSPFDYSKRDTFLDSFSLTREDFGLSLESNNQYFITEIEPVSLNSNVILNPSQKHVLRIYSDFYDVIKDSSKVIKEIYDSSNQLYYFSPVDINAEYDKGYLSKKGNAKNANPISVNSGWLNLDSNDYYVYAKPIIESYSGNYFNIELTNIPRHGAPVLVNVLEGDLSFGLEQMAFSDPATPGNVIFANEEILYGSDEKALYVSHLNIKDITIKDNYTGKVLTKSPLNPEYYVWSIASETATPGTTGYIPLYAEGEFLITTADFIVSGEDKYSYTANKIMVYNSAATGGSILIPGREYTVSYALAKAFYIDRNVYSEAKDEYVAKIYFSATPNSTASYEITYESAIQETSTPLGLYLNNAELPVEEGYVYVSDDEYNFYTAVVEITPNGISKNTDDLIYLTVTSYDEVGNFKPYQTFKISSDLLEMEDEYLTTNKYGVAKTKLRFTGVPTNSLYASLIVAGISYPSQYAHDNSDSGSFIFGTNIEFIQNYNSDNKLSAVAAKPIIEADGLSDNYIKGYIRQGNTPLSATPIIYWRKARTFYDLLENVDYSVNASTPGRNLNSGYVYADNLGNFSIGPFYSQPRNNPGYWFVALETELAATPSSTPNINFGDISYWYERFDNVQYLNEETVLPGYYITTSNDLDIMATPNFTYNLINQDYGATPSGKLNWTPPKWVPINYYDQYQMGLFGSTPNTIATPNGRIGYEES